MTNAIAFVSQHNYTLLYLYISAQLYYVSYQFAANTVHIQALQHFVQSLPIQVHFHMYKDFAWSILFLWDCTFHLYHMVLCIDCIYVRVCVNVCVCALCLWVCVSATVCVLITDAISSKSALSAYLPSPSQSSHSPWIMTNYYYYYYNHHHYYFHNCALTWHHITISFISPRSSISNDNAIANDNSSLLGLCKLLMTNFH